MSQKYIAIEGIDGSGKTTVLKKIQEYLISKNKKFTYLKEPGTNGFEGEVRQLLLGDGKMEGWFDKIDPIARQSLFSACRFYMFHKMNKNNDLILSDRTALSGLAYSLHDPKLQELVDTGLYTNFYEVSNKLIAVIREAIIKTPTTVIHIDIDPSIARARREAAKRVDDNTIDQKSDSYFEKINLVYRNDTLIKSLFGNNVNILRIDNNKENVLDDLISEYIIPLLF
jgi:dTMP kinase